MNQRPSSAGASVFLSNLGIEVFEFAWSNPALSNERIDLAQLEPDNSAEAVCGQLPLVDQPVERARSQPQRRCRFFRGQPVAVCRCHGDQLSTLSQPLSTSQFTRQLTSGVAA